MPSLLVTVGSTSFPALSDYIAAPETRASLHQLSIDSISLQYGAHAPPPDHNLPSSAPAMSLLSAFDYTPDLHRLMTHADVVVSHAGAGTILEAVQLHKRLVVVVNSTLMDNHQAELADAMHAAHCCVVLRDHNIRRLPQALATLLQAPHHPAPPQKNHHAFASLLAEEIISSRP